jgi:hypothetical protein
MPSIVPFQVTTEKYYSLMPRKNSCPLCANWHSAYPTILSVYYCCMHYDILMLGCLITAETIYWPAFIIATLAAVVASQATISATYSIVKQALALGCFPRVSVVHTSKKFLGQIYIPDINWVLMILCIAVTAGFKNKIQIANAYGELYFSQLSLHLEYMLA